MANIIRKACFVEERTGRFYESPVSIVLNLAVRYSGFAVLTFPEWLLRRTRIDMRQQTRVVLSINMFSIFLISAIRLIRYRTFNQILLYGRI